MKSTSILWLITLSFALFFSGLSLQQHWTYQTHGLDLGNVDQALWNTAHGEFAHFTLMAPVESRLALHVEPILLLFVPLYWLGLGRPEVLLITQATVVALGAWPLYHLTRHHLPQLERGSLLIPLAYLLYPPLQSAVLYEFHAVTLAPTFILWALLALARQQTGWFLGFALLTMACKEDMPLLIAALGVTIALRYRAWRLAGLTITLSLSWFVTAVLLIQPLASTGGNIQLDRYAWLGDGLPEILLTLLTRPTLVLEHLWFEADGSTYLSNLLFPTAYLSLLSPLSLLPMLPTLAINLLSANPFSWRLEDFHYAAPLAPFVFVSAVEGVAWVTRCRWAGFFYGSTFSVVLLLTLLTCTLTYHYHRGYTPLAAPFSWPSYTHHQAEVAHLINQIPPQVAVFAQPNLAPHLTHRRVIYDNFALFTDPDFAPQAPIEAVILDPLTLANRGGIHQYLRDTLTNTPPQTRLIALPPHQPTTPPDYNLAATFGDALQLTGHSLHFDRQEEVELSVDLLPLAPLPPDLRPVLYLLDEAGQPIGATTDLQPLEVWYPIDQWAVGERVRLRFNTLPWYTRDTLRYRLALGVTSNGDVWDVGQRLRPTISQPTAVSPRLTADGTLLELARLEQTWQMPHGSPLRRQFDRPQMDVPLPDAAGNFAEHLTLLGYDAPRSSENQLSLTLYWQAGSADLAAVPNLTRFVQVISAEGQVYAQNDSYPDNGQYPVHLWQPNEVVTESVILTSPERWPNVFSLYVGLYSPSTGNRLPLPNGQNFVSISP